MSRRTRPDMSLHTSSSSSHLESSSSSSAISRRVTRSTRSSSVQRTIPTRSAQPTPVKSLPFTNQREGQGRSLPTTSSEDDDEDDDDEDEDEDEVQIEGTPHRLEVTNVRGRTTTYTTPSVTSHTYRSPPKSPTQLRAESDAGVYRIDACNSHEAHITDMFDGRRYSMEEHHHGHSHSHGSPYRVQQQQIQQRSSPQQMKTVHETNSTYTEEIVHDAPPSWNYATIALISLLVLLTGLAVAPYALRTIREPHGYIARPSTDGILRQQDLDHLHKHLKHESERALHSLSNTLTESIHKEQHHIKELQHDITQRMNMAKKEWTHELKRVSDELSTLIRISNAEEAEALQKLRDTVMSKLRDEMTTSLDTTRNRILTELRDEWGTKMSNNNQMLASHQKENIQKEMKKMMEHVDGKIHDVTSHIDTSIKSAITSESQRIHKELKTMEEKWEKNVDDKITSAIATDNIQDNKNIHAAIQADIPRESDAIAKALKQQYDVQQKYVKDAIQVSEKSMVQRVLDELQKKGGDVDPDLVAKVLAAVDKRVAERTKEPEKVGVSSIRSELLSTLRDEMTSTLTAHTKHTDDAITRVSETTTSQYENLVKQLKKQQEQVQAQAASQPASPTSEEIEQHIKQAVTDALQKQKKDVIDAATKAATRAAEAVTQHTGSTTPVTIPAESVDENAIVEAVLAKIAKDLQESRTKTAHVADQIKQVLEHVSHMDTHVNTLSTQSEQQMKTVLSRMTSLESRPASSTSEPATCTSGNCSATATANVDITQLQAWVKEELEKQRNATRIELESTRKSTTQEIERALEKYSADRTEMIDFALGTTGGRVITASRTHRVQVTNGLLSYIKDCYLPAHKPDEMLRDSMSVGSCWPMSGSTGYALIYLRDPIIPTHVTLQHISHLIAPEYTTTPKSFRVWGVSDVEADRARQLSIAPRGDLLGTFTYAAKHTQLQTFALQTPPSGATSYRHINFEILSNYGNPNYTCIYRFRVHGTPVGTGTSLPHGIDEQHQ